MSRFIPIKPLVGGDNKSVELLESDTVCTVNNKVAEIYGIKEFQLYNQRFEPLDDTNLREVSVIILYPKIQTGKSNTTSTASAIEKFQKYIVEAGKVCGIEVSFMEIPEATEEEPVETETDPFIRNLIEEAQQIGLTDTDEYTEAQRIQLQRIYNKMHDETIRRTHVAQDNKKLQTKIELVKERLQKKSHKKKTPNTGTYMGLKKGFLLQ